MRRQRTKQKSNATPHLLKYEAENKFRKTKDLLQKTIFPLNAPQKQVFDSFHKNHLILNGSAGTGKTYVATYNALKYMRDHSEIEKIIFVRPLIQTHDIGFLPGGVSGGDKGKLEPFMATYSSIVNDLCGRGTWENLLDTKFEFACTSFLRGITLDNAIIIFDEAQNATFHELDTLATRIGSRSKLIICGDYYQSDLKKKGDKEGILKFLSIMKKMDNVVDITFKKEHIVRSRFVKDYIIEKEKFFGLEENS